MTIRSRVVHVHQFPEQITEAGERKLLCELRQQVETRRPCVVLDFSKVRRMDMSGIHLLLSCLEEVMKRNGDVRLASLRSKVEAILQMTGMNRLFEVYETTEDAVQSFQKRIASNVPLGIEADDADRDSSYAA